MFCCINPHSTQTCTRTCTTHSHTQLAAVCKNSLSTPLKLTDRCWTFHRLNYMDLWLSNTHTHTHTLSNTDPTEQKHIQKTSIQRLWCRWKMSSGKTQWKCSNVFLIHLYKVFCMANFTPRSKSFRVDRTWVACMKTAEKLFTSFTK